MCLLLSRILLVGLFGACGLAGCTAPPPAASSKAAASQPNIIYILADDLGYGDLGSYGQTQIATPHLDRMAELGLRFTDHYAGSTVCAPSRSVLMTGRHTGYTFRRGNSGGAGGFAIPIPDTEPSVPRLLKRAGYNTACIGKWGLGGPGHPEAFGFDFFYGFLNQSHAHNHYPEFLWRNERREKTGNLMTDASRLSDHGGGVSVKRVAYADDLFFKESSAWIARQAKNDQPFSLPRPDPCPTPTAASAGASNTSPSPTAPSAAKRCPTSGPTPTPTGPGRRRAPPQ